MTERATSAGFIALKLVTSSTLMRRELSSSSLVALFSTQQPRHVLCTFEDPTHTIDGLA